MSVQERVAGGPLGKAVGRAKQLAGAALGREELDREGRLQESQAEADMEAAEIEAEEQAERKRAEEEHQAAELQRKADRAEAAAEALDRKED